MQTAVKIVSYDPHDLGSDAPEDWGDEYWHLRDPSPNANGARILCSGMYFGIGESNMVCVEKKVARGGITCKECLEVVKAYKAIKL